MTRTIRIGSQLFFFSLFCFFVFFVNRNGPAQHYGAQWFLQLNPLVALLTSIASRVVVTAVLPGAAALVVLTVLFGRVFCGFACPLGAAIDFVDHAIIGKARHISRRPHAYWRRLKYVLLLALIVLAVFGVIFPLFFDPISLITRIMALILQPLMHLIGLSAVNAGALFSAALNHSPAQLQPIDQAFSGSLFVSALFLFLFVGGFWDRRFWCQYVCPSGALLGLLSLAPFLRRRVVSQRCNSCHACVSRLCPTRAIGAEDPSKTSSPECILCGVCSANNRGCSVIGFAKMKPGELSLPDLKRRHVVAGLTAGLVALPVVRSSALDTAGDDECIRPPGALPEELFLTRCIACAECMKACPSHALGPSGLSGSLMRLATPRLVARVGYCEPQCTACSHVCPTVALRHVQDEDKPFVKIGTAVVDRFRCIAWRGERRCLTCMTHCPYQAIEEQSAGPDENAPSGPVVDKDLCTGCGKCEYLCPMRGARAIRVCSHGERRVESGPFISEGRRAKISAGRLKNKKGLSPK